MRKEEVTSGIFLLILCLCFKGLPAEDAMQTIMEARKMKKEAVRIFQQAKDQGKEGIKDIKKSYDLIEQAIQMVRPLREKSNSAENILEELSRTLFWLKKFTPVHIYVYKKGKSGPSIFEEEDTPAGKRQNSSDALVESEKDETVSEEEMLFAYAADHERKYPDSLEKTAYLYKEILNYYPDSEFGKKARKRYKEIQEEICKRHKAQVQGKLKKAIKTHVGDLDRLVGRREYEKIVSGFDDAIALSLDSKVKNLLKKEQRKYKRLSEYKQQLIVLFSKKQGSVDIEAGFIGIKSPGKVAAVMENGIALESTGKVVLPWSRVPDEGLVSLGRMIGSTSLMRDKEFGIVATQFGNYEVALEVFQEIIFAGQDGSDVDQWLIRATQGYKEQESKEIDREIARARRLFNAKDETTAIKMLMSLLKKYSRNQILRSKLQEISSCLKEFSINNT